MNNKLLLLGLSVLVICILLYFNSDKLGLACNFCPKCGLEAPKGKCDECPHKKGHLLLKKMSVSCSQNLRAVVREDMVNSNDVEEFLSEEKRVIVLTDIEPETMIKTIENDIEKEIDKIKIVGISSSVVNDVKYYIVISIIDGNLEALIEPTEDFVEAFEFLNKSAREQLGSENNSLAFFIDESVPCDVVTPISEMDEDVPISNIETLCGDYRH